MPSSEVMHKWKSGSLHSGSSRGPIVHNQRQAVAIMLSEKKNESEHGGRYQEGTAKPRRQYGGGPVASS